MDIKEEEEEEEENGLVETEGPMDRKFSQYSCIIDQCLPCQCDL